MDLRKNNKQERKRARWSDIRTQEKRRIFSRVVNTDKQQGSILVLVLLIISLLVVLVIESLHQMRVEATSAKIFTASVQGRALARSGRIFMEFLLARDTELDEEEGTKSDHYGEFWTGFLHQEEVAPPVFSSGELNASIRDEQGKFPINFLVDQNEFRLTYQQVFERLLQSEPLALEPEQVEIILDSVKDWLDSGEMPGEYGAEDDYYVFAKKDYACKDGPLASLAELMLVKGIDQELYHGRDGKPGLKDLLTVHSTGQININTAPAIILTALVPDGIPRDTAREFSQEMLLYRQTPEHFDFLHEKDWYRNRMSGYNDIHLPANMIGCQSRYFSALITAQVGSIPVIVYTVLKRDSEGIVTVHYEVQ